MTNEKLIAVVGGTGSQGGGLVRAILEDVKARGDDAVMERWDDHLDPELAHDAQAGDQILLGTARCSDGGPRGCGSEAVQQRVDVSGGERDGPAL